MSSTFYRPHARVTFDNTRIDRITGEVVTVPSRTKQEFKRECDINNVIRSFSQTGMFRHVSANAGLGAYRDLPDHIDFQESLHQVQLARDAFMTLPSKLRSRFGNDPAEFLAFCHDPANLDEMRSLGLANPASPSSPPSPVATTAPTGPSGGAGGQPPAEPPKAA